MGLFRAHGGCGGRNGQPRLRLARAHRPCHIGRTNRSPSLTNRIAIALGLILIAAIVVDVMVYGTEHLIFLAKKMMELMEWIAFWR